MERSGDVALSPGERVETANDRFKRRSASFQSSALVLAVLLHAAVLVTWPTMTSGIVVHDDSALQVVLPPEVDIPAPPEQLARPAMPVIGSTDLPPDATILPNTWDDWTPERLTPPAARPTEARDRFEHFSPSMVAPRVLNPDDVQRALQRNYPPLLRDAGIGGSVNVLLWLDERGSIVKAEIGTSSGHEALDQAALKVLDVMRLSPAMNHDRAARVIVEIPIQFRTR